MTSPMDLTGSGAGVSSMLFAYCRASSAAARKDRRDRASAEGGKPEAASDSGWTTAEATSGSTIGVFQERSRSTTGSAAWKEVLGNRIAASTVPQRFDSVWIVEWRRARQRGVVARRTGRGPV